MKKEQFIYYLNKQCYICNKKPNNIYLNGIDRFNNSIGYIVENCRSCCSTCNYLKGDMEFNEFLEYLKKINL